MGSNLGVNIGYMDIVDKITRLIGNTLNELRAYFNEVVDTYSKYDLAMKELMEVIYDILEMLEIRKVGLVPVVRTTNTVEEPSVCIGDSGVCISVEKVSQNHVKFDIYVINDETSDEEGRLVCEVYWFEGGKVVVDVPSGDIYGELNHVYAVLSTTNLKELFEQLIVKYLTYLKDFVDEYNRLIKLLKVAKSITPLYS